MLIIGLILIADQTNKMASRPIVVYILLLGLQLATGSPTLSPYWWKNYSTSVTTTPSPPPSTTATHSASVQGYRGWTAPTTITTPQIEYSRDPWWWTTTHRPLSSVSTTLRPTTTLRYTFPTTTPRYTFPTTTPCYTNPTTRRPQTTQSPYPSSPMPTTYRSTWTTSTPGYTSWTTPSYTPRTTSGRWTTPTPKITWPTTTTWRPWSTKVTVSCWPTCSTPTPYYTSTTEYPMTTRRLEVEPRRGPHNGTNWTAINPG